MGVVIPLSQQVLCSRKSHTREGFYHEPRFAVAARLNERSAGWEDQNQNEPRASQKAARKPNALTPSLFRGMRAARSLYLYLRLSPASLSNFLLEDSLDRNYTDIFRARRHLVSLNHLVLFRNLLRYRRDVRELLFTFAFSCAPHERKLIGQ